MVKLYIEVVLISYGLQGLEYTPQNGEVPHLYGMLGNKVDIAE